VFDICSKNINPVFLSAHRLTWDKKTVHEL
ncbi:hypothetical protein BOH78_0116, partial [Pichia kudriavzevii]